MTTDGDIGCEQRWKKKGRDGQATQTLQVLLHFQLALAVPCVMLLQGLVVFASVPCQPCSPFVEIPHSASLDSH